MSLSASMSENVFDASIAHSAVMSSFHANEAHKTGEPLILLNALCLLDHLKYPAENFHFTSNSDHPNFCKGKFVTMGNDAELLWCMVGGKTSSNHN